jgi:hypothetical protein
MPTQGTAKAKAKPAATAKRTNPAAPPVVISITNGAPDKDPAYVDIGGTAQFDSKDPIDYRLRLWGGNHDHHAAIDVLLPALGSITVMTDPEAAPDDETPYDLLPTNVQNSSKGKQAAGGGGGKIIIGPGPAASKKSR